ncbi:hypothetical protein IX51_06915 [uncultured archaeon]|nr:hypothetical protein IX51_06915 [uncultured archaeon]
MVTGGLTFLAVDATTHGYPEGPATLTFTSSQNSFSLGTSHVKQSWSVYQMVAGGKHLLPMNLGHPQIKGPKGHTYIYRSANYSTAKIGTVNSVTMADLEQSLIITNKEPHNSTFIVVEHIKMPASNTIAVKRFNSSGQFDFNGKHQSKTYAISHGSYMIGSNGLFLSWLGAESNFVAGSVIMASGANYITLVFAPIKIPGNATYTIDPTIGQYKFTTGKTPIYDSSGNLIAKFMLSARVPSDYEWEDNNFALEAATTIQPIQTSFGVNQINQAYKWTGDTLGNNPSNKPQGLKIHVTNVDMQEHGNSSALSLIVADLVWAAISAVATYYDVPLISPFGVVSAGSVDTIYYNSWIFNQDAGQWTSATGYGYNLIGSTYLKWGFIPTFKNAYIFGMQSSSDQFNFQPSQSTYESFTYTVTIWMSTGGQFQPRSDTGSLYGGSDTTTLGFIWGYNRNRSVMCAVSRV